MPSVAVCPIMNEYETGMWQIHLLSRGLRGDSRGCSTDLQLPPIEDAFLVSHRSTDESMTLNGLQLKAAFHRQPSISQCKK